MIGVVTRMALFFAGFLGVAWLCVFAVNYQPPEPCGKSRKILDDKVAGKVRLWDRKTGVDSFRLDACRTEKMKMGAFVLGWFDVLCLDGLVLNLPLEEGIGDRGLGIRDQGKKNGATEAFARVLPQSLLESVGVAGGNISGIRIKGLVVNRVENRREVPVFAADEAKNYREMLKLKNCRVFNEGRTNSVGVAYIVLQPAPALVWKDGMRRLDDLLPNLSCAADGRARLDEAAAAVSSKPPYRTNESISMKGEEI